MDKKMDYRVRWDEVDKKLIKVPTHDYEKTSKRVYKMDEINKLMKMTLEDIVHQTHLMTDDELKYDRGAFMRQTNMVLPNNDTLDEDIHSVAIQYEQIRRWGKIIYNQDKIEESK